MKKIFWTIYVGIWVTALMASAAWYEVEVMRTAVVLVGETEDRFLVEPGMTEGGVRSGMTEEETSHASRRSRFASPPQHDRVTLVAVGDVMLSRYVATKMKKYEDYKYPFLKTAEFLREADITFGNLECPISDGREIRADEMLFRADREVREGLVYAGFDVLSVANNHTMNFGEKGMTDTLHYLKVKKIAPVGGGRDYGEAHAPVIKEVNGLKIAFLAYTDTDVVPDSYGATGGMLEQIPDRDYIPSGMTSFDRLRMTKAPAEAEETGKAGVAFMNIGAMEVAVQAAKEKADVVVVSMHSGTEYTPRPNKRQTEFAHKAIEAGAKLVIGHHPHVTQTVEEYQDGYIIYSLGNFVFDQMWSQNTREGMVAKIVLGKDEILGLEFFPIVIEDYLQPRWAKADERKKILNRLDVEFASQPRFYWEEGMTKGTRQGIYLGEAEVWRKTVAEGDLDGDGTQEKAVLENGRVYFYHDGEVVWESEAEWQAENVVMADVDNDGVMEMVVSLWKWGKYGPNLPFWLEENEDDWGNHLFLYEWDGEEVKLAWGASTIDAPIREMAVADVDGDGKNELVVLEGDYEEAADELAQYVTTWKWSGWSFYHEWRSEEGRYYGLEMGGREIGVRK